MSVLGSENESCLRSLVRFLGASALCESGPDGPDGFNGTLKGVGSRVFLQPRHHRQSLLRLKFSDMFQPADSIRGSQPTPSSPNKQARLNVPAELLVSYSYWLKSGKLKQLRIRKYNDEDERDSLNTSSSWSRSNPAGTTKISLNRSRSTEMLDQKENFCYLWIVLSSLYGKLLVVLMVAFCLVEVMDNNVRLLSLQGIYLMYLYVGSIAVIISIYIWVLVDSCSSFTGDTDESITTSVMGDTEIGRLTLSRFGSLKRAHISKDATSTTSFYLRIGALAFGLGTLVFNGLEMAMHSMMEGPCLNDVVFVHPVLHGLFTFLQMHFLFVNSQVLVEKFGLIARFGFMHLAATNLALWMRLVVWESGIEWTYFVHLAQSVTYGHSTSSHIIPTPLQLKGFPKSMTAALTRVERDTLFYHNLSQDRHGGYQPISDSHISQVVALHNCLNTNTLGQLWTSSMPFLYPFIVQFSLIAAGVTYVMGQNVGRDRIPCMKYSKKFSSNTNTVGKLGPASCLHDVHHYRTGPQIDCSGASKGLFLGLLCLVASIVVIIIFLVVKEDEGFPAETLFWITSGTLGTILLLSVLVTIPGLVQIRKLCHTGKSPMMLDTLLSTVSLCGVQLYSVFGIVVGASSVYTAPAYSVEQRQHIMLLTISSLQLVQSVAQSTLIEEGLRRGALTRYQLLTTPARQVITFLLCSNMALWALDSFVIQSWLSQELQLKFMGVLAWGVISRVALPLLVFYRFHSGVLLLEVWQHAYSKGRIDLGP